MRLPSLMKHSFSRVEQNPVPRSLFDRSHGHKTTFSSDYLIPIMVDEALPGSTHKLKCTAFFRLQPQVVPIMDNMYVDIFWFAVNNRILYENWEKLCGQQDNPQDSIDYTVPVINFSSPPTEGDIYDYMGIPANTNFTYVNDISALPLRAYYKIWNDWFRHTQLDNSLTENTGAGPDLYSGYTLQKRNKRHDYFTACLPYPQITVDGVDLPIGDKATVYGDNIPLTLWDQRTSGSSGAMGLHSNSGGDLDVGGDFYNQTMPYNDSTPGAGAINYDGLNIPTKASGLATGLYADLSGAIASTVNELRENIAIQHMLERDARGGTGRYVEILKAHFGVSPNYPEDRSEFLGSSTARINANVVPQTSETGTTPQGTLTAFSTGVSTNGGFVKSFVEHSIIIGLACLRSDLTYQQGIERMWRRSSRYDFYWPAFANLGEQAVLQSEINSDGGIDGNAVFGYAERWSDYRHKNSRISGEFRSKHSASLDAYHCAQELDSTVTLNASFMKVGVPMDRNLAVATATQDNIIADFYFDYKCALPMPVYSTPGLRRL